MSVSLSFIHCAVQCGPGTNHCMNDDWMKLERQGSLSPLLLRRITMLPSSHKRASLCVLPHDTLVLSDTDLSTRLSQRKLSCPSMGDATLDFAMYMAPNSQTSSYAFVLYVKIRDRDGEQTTMFQPRTAIEKLYFLIITIHSILQHWEGDRQAHQPFIPCFSIK